VRDHLHAIRHQPHRAAMKPRCSNQRNRALTLTEVVVVFGLLVLLALMLAPAIDKTRPKAYRIICLNSLKQVGLACKVWAGDNGDKYPMQVSVTNGGTMEWIATGNVAACFQVMSNELSTPRVLYCPADIGQIAATNFTTDFNNGKISYFIGLDADPSEPQMLLSGDDNFAVGGIPVKSGLVQITTNSNVAWTSGRHVSYDSRFWTPARSR